MRIKFSWSSPAYIASVVQRPVKEVWAVIESLGLEPVALLDGVPRYDRRAVSMIEDVFAAAGGADDE